MFLSRFHGKCSNYFEQVYNFVKGYSSASFSEVQLIRHVCPMTPKIGLKRISCNLLITYIADLFRLSPNLLKLVAHKLTKKKNWNIYILTGNDVISDFRSAANRVDATFAIIDFTVTKLSYWKTSKLAVSRHTSTQHSTVFIFRPEMTSTYTSGRQQNAQTCSLLVMFGSRFLDNVSFDFERVSRFGKGVSSG